MTSGCNSHLSLISLWPLDLVDYFLLEALVLLWFCLFFLSFHFTFLTIPLSPLPPNSVLFLHESPWMNPSFFMNPILLLHLVNFSNSFVFNYPHYFLSYCLKFFVEEREYKFSKNLYTPSPPQTKQTNKPLELIQNPVFTPKLWFATCEWIVNVTGWDCIKEK